MRKDVVATSPFGGGIIYSYFVGPWLHFSNLCDVPVCYFKFLSSRYSEVAYRIWAKSSRSVVTLKNHSLLKVCFGQELVFQISSGNFSPRRITRRFTRSAWQMGRLVHRFYKWELQDLDVKLRLVTSAGWYSSFSYSAIVYVQLKI